MFVVALTGGIGSGKTTVSNIFKEKNIPVIDTDVISRQIMEQDQPAYIQTIKAFGKEILTSDKKIDRAKLRQLIFSSENKRLQLEAILHPIIWNEVITQLESITAEYCIIVVPLLFETLAKKNSITFNRILVVDLPEELQIKRVKERDKLDDFTIQNIMKSQVSRKTRLNAADDIILNTDNIEQLNQTVNHLHQQYLKQAS